MKTVMVVLAVLAGASLSVGCSNAQRLEAKPARPVKAQTVAPAPPQQAFGIRRRSSPSTRFRSPSRHLGTLPICCSEAAPTDGCVPYSQAIAWGAEPYSRVFMMRIIANE